MTALAVSHQMPYTQRETSRPRGCTCPVPDLAAVERPDRANAEQQLATEGHHCVKVELRPSRPGPLGRPVRVVLEQLMGLPVLRLPSSSTQCRHQHPGGTTDCASLVFACDGVGLPGINAGSAPASPFSRPSQYGLHDRQVRYGTLYTRGFNRFVSSTTAPVARSYSESSRAELASAERARLGMTHVRDGLKTWLLRSPRSPHYSTPAHCSNWRTVPQPLLHCHRHRSTRRRKHCRRECSHCHRRR